MVLVILMMKKPIFVTTNTNGDTRDVTGDLAYFSNSNTGIIVVNNLNKLIEANDIIVGATSNASYNVSSVDSEPLKTVIIITTPDPTSANAEDDFGFTETITEWPFT
jgi:phosphosulfolactate phosphohydrolase-like enzyme